METQNTKVTFHFPEMGAEGALQQGSVLVERLNRDALERMAADRRPRSHEAPPVVRADHNTDIDRELLASIHDSKPKRRLCQPPATDEARNPALTQAFGSLAQRLRARRFTLQKRARSSVAWVVVILAIVCVLTAMLMMGIAISV
jgi:hypothetical protein